MDNGDSGDVGKCWKVMESVGEVWKVLESDGKWLSDDLYEGTCSSHETGSRGPP